MKALVRPTYFRFANGPTDEFVEALLDYAQTCAANGYTLTTSAAPTTPTTSSTTSATSSTSKTSTTSIADSSTTTKTTVPSFTTIFSQTPIIQPSSQRAGLSAGAGAGISISVIAIIAALTLGVIFFLKRRKRLQLAPLGPYPDAIELDPAPIEKLVTGGQSLQELHDDHRELARGINTAGNERFTTSSHYQQEHPTQGAYSTQLPTALVGLAAQQLPQSPMQRRKPLAELQAQTFQPVEIQVAGQASLVRRLGEWIGIR